MDRRDREINELSSLRIQLRRFREVILARPEMVHDQQLRREAEEIKSRIWDIVQSLREPGGVKTMYQEVAFDRYAEGIITTYRNEGVAQKLTQATSALAFLRQHAFEFSDSGMKARHEGLVYVVTYNANKSLVVTQGSRRVEGYIRQLNELVTELTAPVHANPNHCTTCRRIHKKYGMEIEFKLPRLDGAYKSVLFRKTLGQLSVRGNGDYGADGGSSFDLTAGSYHNETTLELRNINGDTPEELTTEMKTRLNRLFQNALDLSRSLPDWNNALSTNTCGIHVHLFHPEAERSKVVAAHTLVGLCLNAFSKTVWNTRIPSYGTPFAHRATEWCRSEKATELRMFNTVRPDVLNFALKMQDRIIKSTSATVAQMDYQRVINVSQSVSQTERAIAYLLARGVGNFLQVKDMQRFFERNYQPLKVEVLS